MRNKFFLTVAGSSFIPKPLTALTAKALAIQVVMVSGTLVEYLISPLGLTTKTKYINYTVINKMHQRSAVFSKCKITITTNTTTTTDTNNNYENIPIMLHQIVIDYSKLHLFSCSYYLLALH